MSSALEGPDTSKQTILSILSVLGIGNTQQKRTRKRFFFFEVFKWTRKTNLLGHACRAMKRQRHEWLKLQCMSLFQRRYTREHTGQWSCHLAYAKHSWGILRGDALITGSCILMKLAMQIRWPSPLSEALQCVVLSLLHYGLGPYQY